ncbi:hypothetical protein LCGC14_0475900 [marine sediment metagenome]|uniref:SprT-like domain-containing protein n=1 Tax=marine sediment metagenome TaxID=412755 RepID=A0A0F9VJI7_9ZZZZ
MVSIIIGLRSEMVKTATLNKIVYGIAFCHDLDGMCEIDPGTTISIMARPFTLRELTIIIHECLHAEEWNKHEENVERASEEIARLLWRLGYRRPKRKK